ncbi:MAG TPA: hypothetical protein VGD01_12300 [Candidatus Elarobacter sp.]|jgi:hypothetical protein
MMRKLFGAVAGAIIFVAVAVPALAFSQTVGVPPGTVSVTVATVGTNNASGQATSASVNSFCPAGSTITVTQPNNTATTSYGSSVNFNDANGNLISTTMVVQGGSAPPDQKATY